MKFKFIHCNIWNGGRLMDSLIEFLLREQPDILAIQEVYDGEDEQLERCFRSIGVLQAATPLKYRAFAPTHNEPHAGLMVPIGNAVLARFPATEKAAWFYDVPFQASLTDDGRGFTHFPCNLQHVTLDLGGTPLDVFNTHGIWDRHGKDNPRRLRMGEIIAERMAGIQPAILCGDFNVNEGTTTISRLGERLTNVFSPDRRVTSFNAGRKPKNSGYATAVVDFVFTTDDITIHRHCQPDVDISDHLPLVVELEI